MHLRAAALLLAIAVSASARAQCVSRFDTVPSYAHGFFLALADFNEDGRLDTLTSMPDEPAVRLNFGRPDGTFDRGPATAIRAALETQPHLFDATTGDWNEDGHADVALAAQALGAVELLLGRGDGTFETPHTVSAFVYPRAVTAADFDGDDHLDLVVADPEQRRVSVFWGNGDGTFATPHEMSMEVPADVLAGDFNADGRDDLVIGRTMLGIDVLVAGTGRTFAAPLRLTIQRDHWGLVARDFDGDAKLDLGLADLSAFVVSTFRGNGDGTFQRRADFPAGLFTEGIAFGEFTGDARLDIVAGNGPDGRVVVLAGLPDGSFSAPVPFQAGGNLWDVRVADFNGDGRDDVLAADLAAYTVLLQNDAHTFPQLETMRVARVVFDAAVADFDGDGNADLAAADLDDTGAAILLGLGDEHATLIPFAFAELGVSPISLAAADFNGDDVPDLLAGCRFEVSVALGQGDGRFEAPRSYLPADSVRYYVVTPGDVDRDGDLDIVVVDRTASEIGFLINDGSGHFLRSGTSIPSDPGLARPLLADVNHDGAADLMHLRDLNDVYQNGPGLLSIRLGNGDGTFGEAQTLDTGLDPWDVRAADLDGDGHTDLLVTSWNVDGDVRIYRGDGTGAFAPAATLRVYGQALDIAVEDFDRNGILDVAVNNGLLVYVYRGAGELAFHLPEAHVAAELPFTIGAADFDRDGWTDIVTTGYFGNVSVQRNEPACRRRSVRQ